MSGCAGFTRDEVVAALTLLEQLAWFIEWEEKYSDELRWDAWAVAREYGPKARKRRAENRRRISRLSWQREQAMDVAA